MPVVVMHARWNGLSTGQQALLEALVEQERTVDGCCSFTSRPDGSSVVLTGIWDSEASMLAFTVGPLARTRTAALLDEPQTVLFAVPDLFAAGYRRAAAIAVPAPRATSAHAGQHVG